MGILIDKGQNHSGSYTLNLLFQDGKAYIMDNHLAAIWCWASSLDLTKQYNLLHIDRHYDLLNSQTEYWLDTLNSRRIDLSKLSINELTSLTYQNSAHPTDEEYPLFRWDNYLPLFNRLYPGTIQSSIFATHQDGDKIDDFDMRETDAWELQENLSYWINSQANCKWIVNLDIDYFFTDYEEIYYQLFTDDFAVRIADEIKKSWDNIALLTIALSPEMCGGWQNARRLALIITRHLSLTWS